jgi:hypothetical protein
MLQLFRDTVIRDLKVALLETRVADLVDEVLFLGTVGTVKCCDEPDKR